VLVCWCWRAGVQLRSTVLYGTTVRLRYVLPGIILCDYVYVQYSAIQILYVESLPIPGTQLYDSTRVCTVRTTVVRRNGTGPLADGKPIEKCARLVDNGQHFLDIMTRALRIASDAALNAKWATLREENRVRRDQMRAR
jgi:hypothetical protein